MQHKASYGSSPPCSNHSSMGSEFGLGISWTNVDSQWNPVYKAFHRIRSCGNESMRLGTRNNFATHCNTHCNRQQRTATHCNTQCNTLHHTHTATHCNTLQHTAMLPRSSATNTATHCNTLQRETMLPRSEDRGSDPSLMRFHRYHDLRPLENCFAMQWAAVYCSVLQCVL